MAALRNRKMDCILNFVYDVMMKYPKLILELSSHTDSRGSDELNQRLSENRAKQTKSFLLKEGFKESQLTTEGKGEKEPIASNDTPSGKAKNRRSTLRLQK